MNKMNEKKKPKPTLLLDIHIAVDRAARIHSTFAAPGLMRNTLPPLRSNELFDTARAIRDYFKRPFRANKRATRFSPIA
jgi:hypothetical protein